jgi:hypothetical protein
MTPLMDKTGAVTSLLDQVCAVVGLCVLSVVLQNNWKEELQCRKQSYGA